MFFSAFATCVSADEAKPHTQPTIANFTLTDIHAQKWSLDAQKDQQVIVVAFVGTQCPLAKLYAPRLAQLATAYKGSLLTLTASESWLPRAKFV